MSAAADAGSIVSGNVITMDPARPRAEAFGVRAGRIVSVGSRAEVRAALGSTAAEFHAERGAIIPGLIDSHNHMLWTGIQRLQADVSGCASIAELLEALRRFAETHPEREWIVSGSACAAVSLPLSDFESAVCDSTSSADLAAGSSPLPESTRLWSAAPRRVSALWIKTPSTCS